MVRGFRPVVDTTPSPKKAGQQASASPSSWHLRCCYHVRCHMCRVCRRVRSARQVDLEEIGHRGEDHRTQGEPYQRASHTEAGGQKARRGRGYPDSYNLCWVEDGLLLPFLVFLFFYGKTLSVYPSLTGGRDGRVRTQSRRPAKYRTIYKGSRDPTCACSRKRRGAHNYPTFSILIKCNSCVSSCT